MDVEKLKKINLLANTLRQHGIAANRETAAEMAGRITGKEDDRFDDIITVEEQPSAEMTNEPEKSAGAESQMKEEKGISEERIIKVLQSFSDHFANELKKLEKKIEGQDRKLGMFIAEYYKNSAAAKAEESMAQFVSGHVAQNGAMQQQVATVQQNLAQQQKPVQQNMASGGHPRSGNYSSEDVAIEDFFYFGNK